jgi:hypothetical protein
VAVGGASVEVFSRIFDPRSSMKGHNSLPKWRREYQGTLKCKNEATILLKTKENAWVRFPKRTHLGPKRTHF